MRIAICDDDESELLGLLALITEYQLRRKTELHCRTFQNGIDLLYGMKGGEYDLIFLDVFMPGFSGIGVARELRDLDKSVKLIFLTASPDFAVESYSLEAYHYLLKPATKEVFFPLLDKARSELAVQEEQGLLLRDRGSIVRLPFGRLEYVEVMNKTVSFHLTDGSVRKLSASLSDFEEELLSRTEFLKVHRSYLLNLKQIQSVSAKGAVTKTGHTVPVARSLYAAVKDAYLRLLFQPQPPSPPVVFAPSKEKASGPDGPWRILLVDDEPEDRSVWSRRLQERGCVVNLAQNGREALELSAAVSFDCILLEVMLSGEDGFDLCGRLGEITGAPVIFLSCLTDPDRQLKGFAAGGIDYIAKDTPADLFWAKVETRIRLMRAGRTQLFVAPLLLDLSRRKVTLDGKELILTPTEFDLLWLLADHAPHVYTPEELYRAVWSSQQWDGGQTVQVHISRLRRKLENAYPCHYFLDTVRGEGYRLLAPRDADPLRKDPDFSSGRDR